MAVSTELPVGIEDFGRIRNDGFYYIDKTGLIKGILENRAYVNLFTRPRRFGKTLNMSMLKYYFEVGSDKTLFDGLEISRERELCQNYMGKFPVISLSLKGVEGENFDDAKGMLRRTIGREALRFQFLADSSSLSVTEFQQYKKLIELDATGDFAMTDGLLKDSLLILSHLLSKHYRQKVILLIDEYDVPLDKAYQAKYYDSMINLMRGLFGQALKTNDSMYFAVLTGCLRISKESIFTGFNNFKVFSVMDVSYNEYFGFTDKEVKKLLAYYGFTKKYNIIKEWYDGYHFGNTEVYCPWDVINYCFDFRVDSSACPKNYWVNTSSNDIVRKFINKANLSTRKDIEILIDGGSIKRKIRQELTYRDLDSDIDNLWSILFTTGYLTRIGGKEEEFTELIIPNREIRWIFTEQIYEWFKEEAKKDSQKLEDFCRAFQENDVGAIEAGFTSYLKKTISIRDTSVKKDRKENFYHGILLGLFAHMDNWAVMSNAESGEGYCDILIEAEDAEIGIVIELKYAENAHFDAACQKALQQITDKNYEEVLIDDGMKKIYRYGIACYKKRCKVVSDEK
ncbi:hypothetical protein D7V86_10585 [bacterium D16-51]|nr:hypothetical protein D7V96_11350 [bacterium D16-59]RKI59944.1 hypothetical protein D7V86_10585 [bacterium D16-51]